jgi:hypothetical protein
MALTFAVLIGGASLAVLALLYLLSAVSHRTLARSCGVAYRRAYYLPGLGNWERRRPKGLLQRVSTNSGRIPGVSAQTLRPH